MSPELDKPAQRIPEGAIRLPDITIGGKTPQQLEQALVSGRFGLDDDYARFMLQNPEFTTLPNPQTLSLVRIKVADLGLLVTNYAGNSAAYHVYARANELGLDLCPAEVGPYLRLAYKDQPVNEYLYVGMKEIVDSHNHPSVFVLIRTTDDSRLSSGWTGPGPIGWNPLNEIVFSLRK